MSSVTQQIGTTDILDSIQYLLGEVRSGRYEDEEVHLQVERMIDYIQDFVDWQNS